MQYNCFSCFPGHVAEEVDPLTYTYNYYYYLLFLTYHIILLVLFVFLGWVWDALRVCCLTLLGVAPLEVVVLVGSPGVQHALLWDA